MRPERLRRRAGRITALPGRAQTTRRRLAAKAFGVTAAYDSHIAAWLNQQTGEKFPEHISIALSKVQDLRYGENLHQFAALYSDAPAELSGNHASTVAGARQLHGKELSFNNFLDLDAAWGMVQDFTAPTAAIVKHTNPTGIAAGPNLEDAFTRAYNGDPTAAYGGIVGLNRTVDAATANGIVAVYFEAVIAPSFSEEAIQILARKKSIRLLSMEIDAPASDEIDAESPATPVDSPIPYRNLDSSELMVACSCKPATIWVILAGAWRWSLRESRLSKS